MFTETITRRWWMILVRGCCAIAFGLVALLAPGLTLVALGLCFAVFLVADGALALACGLRALAHREHSVLLIFEGGVGLVAGAFMFAWPGIGVFWFVLLAAAWALLSGVALLVATLLLPYPSGRLAMGAAAVLSLALGGFLLAHPTAGGLVLAIWLGAYALVSGVMMVGAAMWMRTGSGRLALI